MRSILLLAGPVVFARSRGAWAQAGHKTSVDENEMSVTVSSRRKVASTGLEVTALGIGSSPLGGLYCDVPTVQALEVLSTAWDLGIRYFDTAPFYGSTRAEHLVGQILRERDGSHVLSTKVGRLMTTERAGRKLPPERRKARLLQICGITCRSERFSTTAMTA